jgi:hypothetical protein
MVRAKAPGPGQALTAGVLFPAALMVRVAHAFVRLLLFSVVGRTIQG